MYKQCIVLAPGTGIGTPRRSWHPTSHLPSTCCSLQVGRTAIVVAHRLSTVVRCTEIAAVYRGRVLEQGTHTELLAKNGYYKHLWESAQG